MKPWTIQLLRSLLVITAVVGAIQGHSRSSTPSLLPEGPTWSTEQPYRLADPIANASLDLLHMPSPYSYRCLGIFCKAEVKMNRWCPIPLMIRIGDVEQAEELDGKGPNRGAPH